MRLSEFIQARIKQIMQEWEMFARTLPAAQDMDRIALRDHVEGILEFVARDIDSFQTVFAQSNKAKGLGSEEGGSEDSAAQIHADLRAEHGFDMVQLAAEYRALRASVIRLWNSDMTHVEKLDLLDLIRFNEAIDQALMESMVRFKDKIEHSKDLFIGILSHDLRTPLGAIEMSNQLLLEEGNLNEEQSFLSSQIEISAVRMKKMIIDLLDLTRINLGTGIPITIASMDMGDIGRKAVEEMQIVYPDRVISFEATGNLGGLWDSARINQIFSNLLGNAVQHGFKHSPIVVTVTGHSDEIVISVHNEGIPIPQTDLRTIFESLTRIVRKEEAQKESTSLGLGLYIVKEIVVAHGGKINVTSSEKEGTMFTVRIPRQPEHIVNDLLTKQDVGSVREKSEVH